MNREQSAGLPNGCHAATSQCPTHPFSPDTLLLHPLQIHPLTVRVLDDAVFRYSKDTYWDSVPEDQRDFGLQVLNKILGGTYRVMSLESYGARSAYRLRIFPEFYAFNAVGVPQRINAAHVPTEYVEVVKSMPFWEAK